LVEHAERIFPFGISLDRQARRPRQYHGVHAHSLHRVPDPGDVFIQPVFSAWVIIAALALSQMDVPTCTPYVKAVVTPAERPAAGKVEPRMGNRDWSNRISF
jgi:hypothetical protein